MEPNILTRPTCIAYSLKIIENSFGLFSTTYETITRILIRENSTAILIPDFLK